MSLRASGRSQAITGLVRITAVPYRLCTHRELHTSRRIRVVFDCWRNCSGLSNGSRSGRMDARRELPDEALVPARLVVEDKAFHRIAELVTSPPAPTQALRQLMRGQGG